MTTRLKRITTFFSKPWVNIVSVLGALFGIYVSFFPSSGDNKLNIYKDRDLTVLKENLGNETGIHKKRLNILSEGDVIRISRFKIENYGIQDIRKDDFEGSTSLVAQTKEGERFLGYSFFNESVEHISNRVSAAISKDSVQLFFDPFNLRKSEWLVVDLWTISKKQTYPSFIWQGYILDAEVSYYPEGEDALFSKDLSNLGRVLTSWDFWLSLVFPALGFFGVLGLYFWITESINKSRIRKFLGEIGFITPVHQKIKRSILLVFNDKRLKLLQLSLEYLLSNKKDDVKEILEEREAFKHFIELGRYQKGIGMRKNELANFDPSLELLFLSSMIKEGLAELGNWDENWTFVEDTEEKLSEILFALKNR